MNRTVCVRSDTLMLFLMVGIGLIIWALYLFHQQGLAASQEREGLLRKEMNLIRQHTKVAQERANQERANQETQTQIALPPPNVPIANIPLPNTRPGAFGMPVNLPTRGQPTDFYVVGYLFRDKHPDQMLQLFEKYWGSSRYEYITYNHINPNITIPVYNHNWNQLSDGDCVRVQGYRGRFNVALYPRPLYNFL